MKDAKTLSAVVEGAVKWDNDRPFRVNLRFTMARAKEGDYGTGYYITMEAPEDKGFSPMTYDVRYVGTSNIEKVAKMAADTFFGENLRTFTVVK